MRGLAESHVSGNLLQKVRELAERPHGLQIGLPRVPVANSSQTNALPTQMTLPDRHRHPN